MKATMRAAVSGATTLVLAAGLAVPAAAADTTRSSGAAPGGPGTVAPYLGADTGGVGTSNTRRSTVWYTLPPGGGASEFYYPDLSTPASRSLTFVVVDADGTVTNVRDSARHHTVQTDARSLTYRETDTARDGSWQLQSTWITDPHASTVLAHVRLRSLDHHAHRLFVLYEPTLSNTPSDDVGRTVGKALVAHDAHAASALVARPAFTATSNGYRGTSDGFTDLRDGRMDWHYSSTAAGNIVQTGRTALTGLRGHRALTLRVAFAATAGRAVHQARTTRSFGNVSRAYARGWHGYLARLRPMPDSLHTSLERREYRTSELVLAASEDKRHPGAYVASPSMPWAWGTVDPSGPYHLVWSRDLYEVATGLIADGDIAGASRALTFLFDKQQKADGSFPQNSTVTGKPFWTGLQLDEVADPIILAYQLHRTGAAAWSHVKRAADFLLGFHPDGFSAPWTPQERWENQSGYSPATIASEIAGLVCAATIARHNGDAASAARYLRTADSWHAHLKSWTATTNGPYSSKPYFLRLTKDGHPDRGTTYYTGDGGPSNADQRSVVDPSFLELVRLGVLPANDPVIRNSIKVVDQQLGYRTARGRYWHRASFDGYGETPSGQPWPFGAAPNSFVSYGRGWPLLSGERGEYALTRGYKSAASALLATMSRSGNIGGLLPEQVWDDKSPSGTPGFTPGTPTLSATPLAWTHAQYLRLARDIAAGRVVEQPAVVAARYGGA